MASRFATLIILFCLSCLTNSVFGQTAYYQTPLGRPTAPAYPLANPAAGWTAAAPTGISALPQVYPTAILPAPTTGGYAPVPSGHVPAAPGYAPARFVPVAAGYAPRTTAYAPQAAIQPAAPPSYYLPASPAPTAQAAPSYWMGRQPGGHYAPPATGYFAPPTAPIQPRYVPVSLGYGGPATAGPPAAADGYQGPQPALRPEGSVLNQAAPLMQGAEQVAPYGGAMSGGGEFYGAQVAPELYGGAGLEYGYGNAGYGLGVAPYVSPWFVGLGGLVMSRDDENYYLFSYDSADESRQLTNARNANFDWAGGFEVNFGRTFNCGQNAIEAVYWGLFPTDGVTTTTDAYTAGSLNGILNWDQLNYGLDPLLAPRTADEFVNNSTIHMVRRQNEIHNVEVNLLSFLNTGCGAVGGGCGIHGGMCGKGGGGGCGGAACGGCSACGGAGYGASLAGLGYGGVVAGPGGCGSRWSHDWLVGFRFFRFHDNLLFGAEEAGGNGSFLDEDDEIYYNIEITNNLVGVQLGYGGAYAVSCRCALDYGFKFGLFGNQIDHVSEIGGNQGVATINNGPNAGVDYYVANSKNDVAFLGEANLGLCWRFGSCWSAKIGYRAVAVTGVAHPTNQIYHDLRGIQDVRWVDSNGSLILHGGYARAEYRF